MGHADVAWEDVFDISVTQAIANRDVSRGTSLPGGRVGGIENVTPTSELAILCGGPDIVLSVLGRRRSLKLPHAERNHVLQVNIRSLPDQRDVCFLIDAMPDGAEMLYS